MATVWIVLAVSHLMAVADHGLDDVFITYRHAANLLDGQRLVFNPNEVGLATTSPGLALGLAALSSVLPLSLPWLGTILTLVALLALAILLAHEAARRGRATEGVALGTLLVGSDYLWLHNGNEIAPALALIGLAATITFGAGATARSRPWLGGALCAVASWLRPDLGLAAPILAGLSWRKQRQPPLAFIVGFVAFLAAALCCTFWASGEWLPITLGAKRAQAILIPTTATAGLNFWPTAIASVQQLWSGRATVPLLILCAGGLVPLARSAAPALQTLIATALLGAVAYPLLAVPFATWYVIPMLIVGLAAAVWGAGDLIRSLAARGHRFASAAVLAAAIAALAGLLAVDARHVIHPRPYVRLHLYERAATWMERRSAPGDSFAIAEVGVVGFVSRLPIVDLAGLTTPRTRPLLGTPALGALVLSERPRWIVIHPQLAAFSDAVTSHSGFTEHYVKRRTFESRVATERLVVYERRGSQ